MIHHRQSGPRWAGIERPYRSDDVVKLRGSVEVEHTLAQLGAERLWWLLEQESFVPALDAPHREPGRPAACQPILVQCPTLVSEIMATEESLLPSGD